VFNVDYFINDQCIVNVKTLESERERERVRERKTEIIIPPTHLQDKMYSLLQLE